MLILSICGLARLLHFFVIIVEVEIKVVWWEMADLDLVWTNKAAKVGFACKVALARDAVSWRWMQWRWRELS